MVYEVASGNVKYRSLCCDVVCGKNALAMLPNKLKQYYCAGKVGVVYCENLAAVADSVIRQLESEGYITVRKIFAEGSTTTLDVAREISSYAEDVRFILVIGDSYLVNAAKLDGKRYGAVLIGAAEPSLLTSRCYVEGEHCAKCGVVASFVIADTQTAFHYATDSRTVDVYGRIMSLTLGNINHMLRNVCYKDSDGAVFRALDDIVLSTLAVPYIKNDSTWHDGFLNSSLQIAIYVSMLDVNYDYASNFAHNGGAAICGELLGGEVMTYACWYLLTKLSRLSTSIFERMSTPSDLASGIDSVANACGYDAALIMRELSMPVQSELMRIDCVVREYYIDILAYIGRALAVIDSAILNVRRIYNDVGQSLAHGLDIEHITPLITSMSLLCREYSLVKHLHILGYM